MGRRLRKDEFPSRNHPILSTSVILPVKRKLPRKRSENVEDQSESGDESACEPTSGLDFECDQCCSTDLTIADIKRMEEQIEEMTKSIKI